MPRIRTIKPEFWTSESIGRLPRDARLLFIALWNLADDSGRLRGTLAYLSGAVFPYDDDARAMIGAWLSALEREAMIVRYTSKDGNSYIEIPNWRKHQKIDKPSPSKIPSFAECSPNASGGLRDTSALDQGSGSGSGTKDQGSGKGSKEPDGSEADSVGPLFMTKQGAWRLSKGYCETLTGLFPGVNLALELTKAAAWCESQPPSQRKKANGMHRFLTSWMQRCSKDQRPASSTPKPTPEQEAEWGRIARGE